MARSGDAARRRSPNGLRGHRQGGSFPLRRRRDLRRRQLVRRGLRASRADRRHRVLSPIVLPPRSPDSPPPRRRRDRDRARAACRVECELSVDVSTFLAAILMTSVAAGAAGAVLGLGGGILLVPILTLFYG